ncbi:hypothetical protein COLO4_05364 [Corchorus olitorius]|uniref:Fringe-related protein n=1 Tax=Corchorus olitorius TaxID=93759 RepID=A0A1R3KR91_9ROSI|nr:hypothetical protein COLO4_05364 [Corchorus olitorius]
MLQNIRYKTPHGASCKTFAVSSLIIFILIFCTLSYTQFCNKSNSVGLFGSNPFEFIRPTSSQSVTNSPTNISHIRFVIAGSVNSWKHRKSYIEAWWRPNETRGNVFLDLPPTQEFLPWSSASPPYQINENLTKLRIYPKLANPGQVRMYRSILESFRLGDNKDVRWCVMGDDDSLFFVDNLVELLGKYDHNKYYYIGANSEAIRANYDFSFDMGYGGAGYALSYSLIETLVPMMDSCIERYSYVWVSDQLSSFCLADIGVALTIAKGIHQIDLDGDISGLLSSHPQYPIITLHHFDFINPLYPSKNQAESISHMMEAAKFDQSRMLQQTICYHRPTNWTFSVSWGYSAHIYENIIPRSVLRKPLETFGPPSYYSKTPPLFMFNTRKLTDNPCEAPHVFFMDSIKKLEDNLVITTYNRTSPRNLQPCSASANHSADSITQIQVFLQSTKRKEAGRIECCDVEYVDGMNVADVKLRSCLNGELIA